MIIEEGWVAKLTIERFDKNLQPTGWKREFFTQTANGRSNTPQIKRYSSEAAAKRGAAWWLSPNAAFIKDDNWWVTQLPNLNQVEITTITVYKSTLSI